VSSWEGPLDDNDNHISKAQTEPVRSDRKRCTVSCWTNFFKVCKLVVHWTRIIEQDWKRSTKWSFLSLVKILSVDGHRPITIANSLFSEQNSVRFEFIKWKNYTKIGKNRIPKESPKQQNWKCSRLGLIEPVHWRCWKVQVTVHAP
jgi:hypothetical protein